MSPPENRHGAARRGRALAGLLALSLFGGAVALTWTFLKGGFQGGMPVSAVFSAPGVGQQLPEGGDVKIRGVLVGRIDRIRLEEGDAIVHLALDEGLGLPEDTRAEIRSKTVFGQKWVELIPPDSSSAGILSAGDVIDDDHTQEPLELERALQLGHDLLSAIPLDDLAELLEALAGGFEGREEDAGRAIDDGLVALRAVNARSTELDLSLRQLREFSQWLDDNASGLLGFMESLDAANRALVGAAPQFSASLDSVPTFLDRFAAFEEGVEADLGRLVEDGADVATFVAPRTDDLVDLIVELEPFTTVWNSGLSQPCRGEFESNMTCWQVYQLPGMESRGLYRNGAGPIGDDPSDPALPRVLGAEPSVDAFSEGLLEDRDVGNPLARLLYAPALEALPELVEGDER